MSSSNRRTAYSRKSVRTRLKVERLENRNMFAADIGFSEIELFADPGSETEVAEDNVPAEVDTSLSGSVQSPIAPDSFVQIDADIELEAELEVAEPVTSELFPAPQPFSAAAIDAIFATDEPEELFDEDRLAAIDFQLPEVEFSQIAVGDLNAAESRDDEPEPSQQADDLEARDNNQQDLQEQDLSEEFQQVAG